MEWGVDKAADKLAGDKQEEIKKMYIIIPERKDIPACAKVYLAAYQAEPWNEPYEASEVESYIGNYLDSDVKCCYALVEGEEIRGVALGLVVPSIDSPYLRIEDICVDPGVQRKGWKSVYGTAIPGSRSERMRFCVARHTKRLPVSSVLSEKWISGDRVGIAV